MGVAPTIAIINRKSKIINRKSQDLVTHCILNFNRRRAAETTLSFYLAYFNMSKNLWIIFVVKIFCKGSGVMCRMAAQGKNIFEIFEDYL